MDDRPDTLSLVLFSGTDDRLISASTLVVGAAALGRKVDILVQFWGLDSFRRDRIREPHGVAADAPAHAAEVLAHHRGEHWADILSQAREIGDVRIRACAQSMEMQGLEKDDLDPLVDDVAGIAAFVAAAHGPVVFI
jgi:peroxiredoxin family protein